MATDNLSDHYALCAKQAYNHTLQFLYLGNALNLTDQLSTVGAVNLGVIFTRLQTKYTKLTQSSGPTGKGNVSSNLAEVRAMADAATTQGAGNCGEHAAVAFMYCYTRKIAPAEMVWLPGGIGHAFVLVGRTGGQTSDPFSWPAHTWICDPAKRQVYPRSLYYTYESINPEPYVIYDGETVI